MGGGPPGGGYGGRGGRGGGGFGGRGGGRGMSTHQKTTVTVTTQNVEITDIQILNIGKKIVKTTFYFRNG